MRKARIAAIAAASLAIVAGVSPAVAGTGCNGVVNWLVWGCAPWDNNNGAQFPYFKKKVVSVPIPRTGGIPVTVKNGAALATVNGQQMPVVGGTAALIAQGGGNIVASGGGNIVASGGGNLQVYSQ